MSLKLPDLHPHASVLTVRAGPSRPVRLFEPEEDPRPAEPKRRRRLWEMSGYFHCSIVGTCLATGELRQILVKLGIAGARTQSDHELHAQAVLLAGRQSSESKHLHKALDRKHRLAISQFGKASDEAGLRAHWDGAVQRGDIPGAYWAVLTHPGTSEALARHAFGEVHMLSHLVGAANRADIRRLRALEEENAALQDKAARQQAQLREAVVSREAKIANLQEALGKAVANGHPQGDGSPTPNGQEREALTALVADLRRRSEADAAFRGKAERRLQALTEQLARERKTRLALQREQQELRDELAAAELALARSHADPDDAVSPPAVDLAGMTLLYVGGRPHNIIQLRAITEGTGATFLHHDGGIDDRSSLLASRVSRADIVFFPVDCVSHGAVAVVKQVTRTFGKPYVALRSSGLTSFAAALARGGPLATARREDASARA